DGCVLGRHVQRALAGLAAKPCSREQLERGRRPPSFRGDCDQETAVRAAHCGPLARALERERVAAGAVAEPLRDAGDGRRARVHTLGDLEVREALVEQADDLPAVRERLQLAERAEVSEEPLELLAIAQRERRVSELVQPGDLLDVMSRSRLARGYTHAFMLAC